MMRNKRKGVSRLEAFSRLLRRLRTLVRDGFISETEATKILDHNLDVQMKLHLGRDA